ncbi:hypothetical protein [Tsukamurella tyrosinosolvens]|uniref:hypothetical protein n=1 Tax=Tsukamurella tyrosinosolvens TaxID=57704 RepID=UPI002DD43252|nr:hypothetical protein [Tsukamurella tyrosinosolvens]MEC4615525.1 hypothetical protein [Tsukamurella tyrosinosolvens]
MESDTYYASIPVTNGITDYDECYRITVDQYIAFCGDPAAALTFLADCRSQRNDELLLMKPGSNRGVAY